MTKQKFEVGEQIFYVGYGKNEAFLQVFPAIITSKIGAVYELRNPINNQQLNSFEDNLFTKKQAIARFKKWFDKND